MRRRSRRELERVLKAYDDEEPADGDADRELTEAEKHLIRVAFRWRRRNNRFGSGRGAEQEAYRELLAMALEESGVEGRDKISIAGVDAAAERLGIDRARGESA